jgi:tRNA (uracil-5-)-methyltransferase TRM9
MERNLREVFDQIAPSWYNFRHHTIFRRELEDLAANWKSGRLLNIGCGHGADFLPFAKSFELHGIDFSLEMLKLAIKYAEKYKFTFHLIAADAIMLPYKDANFDHAIAVATYHHLSTEQRIDAFCELKRVLKPGGEAFITVWNRWQPRFWLKQSELMVPWRMKDKTLYRYYNLFTYGELVKLSNQANLEVIKIFSEYKYHFPIKIFSRNICLIVRKKEMNSD